MTELEFEPSELGFDPDDLDQPPSRRSRGLLEADVDLICRQYENGELILQEGQFLTPYFICKILKEQDNLEKLPSIGAVADVLKRWNKSGYAATRFFPLAFVGFSEIAKDLGLEGFIRKRKEFLKQVKEQG